MNVPFGAWPSVIERGLFNAIGRHIHAKVLPLRESVHANGRVSLLFDEVFGHTTAFPRGICCLAIDGLALKG